MKFLLSLLAGLFISTGAFAQGFVCPPPQQSDPQFQSGGNVFGRTAPQWNAYYAAKGDANNGTFCNAKFIGNTVFSFQQVISALGYTPLNPNNNLLELTSKPASIANLESVSVVTATGALSACANNSVRTIWRPNTPATSTFTLPVTPIPNQKCIVDNDSSSSSFPASVVANTGQTLSIPSGGSSVPLSLPGTSVTFIWNASTSQWMSEVITTGSNVPPIGSTGAVVYYSAPSTLASVAGSTNQVLLAQTGAAPIWGAVPNAALVNSAVTIGTSPVSLGGTLASIAGLTNLTTTGNVTVGNTLSVSSPLFVVDPNAGNALTGNALLLYTPTLGDAHQDGMFGYGVIGASTSVNNFQVLHNCKWREIGSPIPAGTKGNFSCYQANVNTAQNNADTNGVDGAEAYGATMHNTGTGPMNAFAIDFEVLGASAFSNVLDTQITTNSSTISANVGGFLIAQAGANAVGFGFKLLTGLFTNALDTSGSTVTNVLKNASSVLTGSGVFVLGSTTVLRSGAGSINLHHATNVNLDTFYNGASGFPRISAENDTLSLIPLEIASSSLILVGTPGAAGAGGLFLCQDTAGAVYRKATCP